MFGGLSMRDIGGAPCPIGDLNIDGLKAAPI
jgi:hypothetical protein